VYSVINTERGILTGGRDANICVFDNKFAITQTMGFFAAISSVCVTGSKLVVGTENAEVLEVVDYLEDTAPNVVVQAHHDGELYALDINPVQMTQFVTVGEDNKIILWDANSRKMLKMGIISSKSGPRRRRTKYDATIHTHGTLV
jgi:WD40 repeat protein